MHKFSTVFSLGNSKPFCIKVSKLSKWWITKERKTPVHIWRHEKGLITSLSRFLFFMIMSIKRDWAQKWKWSKIFMRNLTTLFQNILTAKGCLECIRYISSYLPKHNKAENFPNTLFINCLSYNIRPSFLLKHLNNFWWCHRF